MTASVATRRPPPWRDVRVLRVLAQLGVLLAVVLVARWLFRNLVDGLDDRGISTGFDFLDQRTGFRVADSDFDPNSRALELFRVGAKNTLLSAGVGIGIASVLGLIVGIARLSTNWLVAKLATVFVETLRNIPPLVVILYFNAAVFLSLPVLRQASQIGPPGTDDSWLLLSNSRMAILSIQRDGSTLGFWVLMAVAGLIAAGLWVWRTRRSVATGEPHRRVRWAGLTMLITVVAGLVLLDPYGLSPPELVANRIHGGFATTTAYASVTVALGLYTASHIAEIIRGSIQAVPRGQVEAAQALALSGFQRYRFVVLPQALRIAVPPTINQYLNLTKNTSLAVAVAYPELTNLTTSLIGNGKPAPQSILVLMAIYLSFSLAISLVVNLFNRRFRLVTR